MHNLTSKEQQAVISNPQPEVKLISPCKIGEGILQLSLEQAEQAQRSFVEARLKNVFFIPASGSGSRMFEFLHEFLAHPKEENRGAVERFLNHIEDFAFFYQFPQEIQQQLRERTMDVETFVARVLSPNGLGMSQLPKGLIPFHKHGPFLLNPYHEHVLQGMEVVKDNEERHFHFTIRAGFHAKIQEQLDYLVGLTGKKINVSFSIQDPATDSYAFDNNGQLVVDENNEPIKRPAGHGALLGNLQALDADLIFIKNIDNVQHINHATAAIQTQQVLAGVALDLMARLQAFLNQPTIAEFQAINKDFQLVANSEMANYSLADCIALAKRPVRVCGMVRNDGQAGGGPFWIADDGFVTKQIIEKSQIEMKGEQYRVMIQSTHFNPVVMVCQGKNSDGSKVVFADFADPTKYFIAHKKYKGKDIQFIELPGLWNGSMARWNSVFVEIDNATFSPVKTILDLLDSAHNSTTN
ncbi:MAG: DUF4301 family protein [Fluviicola sp.]|nr:DUF4301 family protein [Fluviicola sp.]MBP6271483.1 DUF4301 family protein [Fluviicola sp.]